MKLKAVFQDQKLQILSYVDQQKRKNKSLILGF